MRAGGLRHEVVIQTPTETENATGESVPTWGTFAAVRAAVEPLRGQEFFASQQLQSSLSVRIRIRYLANVTTKMRVQWENRYFAIEGIIDPEMRHRELQLMCVERAADGWRT